LKNRLKYARQNRKVLAHTPIFSLVAEDWKDLQRGHRQTFYFLECPDWVNIVALDDSDRVLLIRQSRYGTLRRELEIPGGAVDRRDRSPLDAAQRELMEETGCVARKWVLLGRVSPNPAFHRNTCHMYLALGARKTRGQELDRAEDITVTKVPLARLPALVRSGAIRHSIVIAAFFGLYDRLGLLKEKKGRRKG
jgi:8-oxo-dGTP pyrophosphatase MutT (NUDIX family)